MRLSSLAERKEKQKKKKKKRRKERERGERASSSVFGRHRAFPPFFFFDLDLNLNNYLFFPLPTQQKTKNPARPRGRAQLGRRHCQQRVLRRQVGRRREIPGPEMAPGRTRGFGGALTLASVLDKRSTIPFAPRDYPFDSLRTELNGSKGVGPRD